MILRQTPARRRSARGRLLVCGLALLMSFLVLAPGHTQERDPEVFLFGITPVFLVD